MADRFGGLVAVGACVIVAAALAACGSDDAPLRVEASAPTELSKPEFLLRANEICYSTRVRLEAAADDLFAGRDERATPAERREFVERFGIPLLEQQSKAIAGLAVPEGDGSKVDRILAAADAAVAEVRAEPDLLVDGRSPLLERAGALAVRYGANDCRL